MKSYNLQQKPIVKIVMQTVKILDFTFNIYIIYNNYYI